ncbi:MAG: branched-chain amino acid ABC transporter permease [Chloroflexi bacterium]|nr:MAG: branched-chain amino acid ABC transporter permease [Chloroflexota bacterium]
MSRLRQLRPRRWLGQAAFLVFLLSVPAWAPNRFWINVASQALIFAIFAMSLDLLIGYAGMPSFGHAAFYAAGAYGGALWALHLSSALLPLLAVGLMAGASLALVGALALRARGIYFLMLTLAFAQVVWSVLSNNQLANVLGGDIGLISVPRPVLPFAADVSLFRPANFYFLTLTVAIIVYLALAAVVASPFGHTLEGIRENEGRMESLGYPTFRYRLAAFIIAGALAGLAGMLGGSFNFSATPATAFWTTSGLAMIAVIMGGSRSLVGPAAGAIVVVLLQLGLSSLPARGLAERWQLLLGVVFIAFVLFLPGGLYGLLRRRAA